MPKKPSSMTTWGRWTFHCFVGRRSWRPWATSGWWWTAARLLGNLSMGGNEVWISYCRWCVQAYGDCMCSADKIGFLCLLLFVVHFDFVSRSFDVLQRGWNLHGRMETWYLKKIFSNAFHRRRCCILRRGQGHYDLKPEGAGLECHLDALRLEVGESMWSFKAPWWTKLDTFWGIWSLLALQSSWAWLIWGYDCDTTVWWLCLSFRSRSQSRKGTCRNVMHGQHTEVMPSIPCRPPHLGN